MRRNEVYMSEGEVLQQLHVHRHQKIHSSFLELEGGQVGKDRGVA